MEAKKRIERFDIAKGIGILLVIIGHMHLQMINPFIFSFHMPLFFFVSGYFLSEKYSVSVYVRKRARQLLVPYIFACICIIIGFLIKDIAIGHSEVIIFDMKKWIFAAIYASGQEYSSPFAIPSIGAIWFLPAMFFATIIVRRCISYKYKLLLIVIIFYVGYATSQKIWLPFSIQAGMTAAIFLFGGWKCRDIRLFDRKIPKDIEIGMLAIWIFCILFGGKMYLVRNYFGNGLLDVVGAFCACYFIVKISGWIEKYAKRICNILAFFGRNSLIILCFHTIELKLIPWDSIKLVFSGITGLNVESIGIIIIIIILKILWCLVWTCVVLRVPFLKRIFLLSGKLPFQKALR